MTKLRFFCFRGRKCLVVKLGLMEERQGDIHFLETWLLSAIIEMEHRAGGRGLSGGEPCPMRCNGLIETA